ncbi:MAG: CDP-diacylglycerol--serine O-phosphatidyltransferase [Betaproteobacteria bacterium]|nr:CDP-diacylglycerol--serine O-phosphatidyltransferase [Betaproteobacteria bacterium]
MEEGQARRRWLARRRFRPGIFWLPNAITTVSLFAGFYAIVQAMNDRYAVAAAAIFVAMVFDGLDGRVARLTRTQSAFGAEFDSLSDMVSFGAAPALVIYEWALRGLGKYGWACAFAYCACAALRLARFNTNIAVVDKRYFQGLPSPAAAALVAGLVWAMDTFDYEGRRLDVLAAIVTVFAAFTMVSNVRFYSGKDINIRKTVPFWQIVLVALGVAVVFFLADNLPEMLFTVATIYALSGYVMWLFRYLRPEPGTRHPPPDPDGGQD